MMTSRELLSPDAVQSALKSLPEWSLADNAIVRTVRFPEFLQSISFVNAVAHLAERQDHHPDMEIRYSEVTVKYWTHSAGGITELDLQGARETDSLAALLQKAPSGLAEATAE